MTKMTDMTDEIAAHSAPVAADEALDHAAENLAEIPEIGGGDMADESVPAPERPSIAFPTAPSAYAREQMSANAPISAQNPESMKMEAIATRILPTLQGENLALAAGGLTSAMLVLVKNSPSKEFALGIADMLESEAKDIRLLVNTQAIYVPGTH